MLQGEVGFLGGCVKFNVLFKGIFLVVCEIQVKVGSQLSNGNGLFQVEVIGIEWIVVLEFNQVVLVVGEVVVQVDDLYGLGQVVVVGFVEDVFGFCNQWKF